MTNYIPTLIIFPLIKRIFNDVTRHLGNSNFKIALSKNTLVLVSDSPQMIQEYSLSDYSNIYKRKQYPLYNYTLKLKEMSYDFSDFSDFLFINALDSKGANCVMVYDAGTSQHNVLYTIIGLNSSGSQSIMLQVSGMNLNYLAIFTK